MKGWLCHMDNDKKQKFTKAFSKLNVILANRKKETRKVYFTRPSIKSILLSLTTTLLIVDFIFRYMKTFNDASVNDIANIKELSIIGIGVVVTAVIIIIISKSEILKYFRYLSVPLIIVGLLGSYFFKNNLIVLAIFSLIMGTGYGIVFGFTINIFLFSFDMSERLVFCLLLILLFFSYSFYSNFVNNEFVKMIIIPLLLCCFVYVLFLICGDYFVIDSKSEIIPTYSLVLLVGMILIVCLNQAFSSAIELTIHPNGIRTTKSFYSITYYIGFLLCTAVTILAFLYSKKAILFLLVVYFVAVFGANQLTIFNEVFNEEVIFWRQCADVAYGFSTSLGYIIVLMMIAKILDDKATKFNLFYIVLCSLCFTFSSIFLRKALGYVDIRILAITMIIVNAIIALVVFVLNLLGYLETRNTKDTPVGEIDRNKPKYNVIDPAVVLTPKEKVVFDFLLEGLTLRQIAGELGMKYDSVNFHYKNIYKKLEVNSKIELIIRYGDQNK